MKYRQRGLSIVEIVMALVVLAILASTAIPSYVSERTDSRKAAVESIAGSLDSASHINFAVRSINAELGVKVSSCQDVALALEGELSSEYTIVPAKINPGANKKCTVTHRGGESAEFIGRGIS